MSERVGEMTSTVPVPSGSVRESLEQFRDCLARGVSATGTRHLYYQGDLDLVLREGRDFQSVKWTTWRGTGYRRGKVRECFMNAHKLAWQHPELTYVEGFAGRGILPIHHAWCATEDGRVVDPTWREYPDFGDPVEGWEYLGVPFELDFVDEVTGAKGTYGVLSDFSLYERALPVWAVRNLTGAAILAAKGE